MSSTADRIYLKIYDAIVQHYLPPATKLSEDSLGAIFGVSRTIIHRVLVRLAHDGIVELLPNRGAFVAKPSVQATRDVFAVRRTLECAMAGELAKALPLAAIHDLRTVVAAEVEAKARFDKKTQLRLSGEFHLRLADATGNIILRDILKELISLSSLAIAIYQRPGTSGCRPEEHAHLLENFVARNDDGATTQMKEHLLNLERGLDFEPERSETVDVRAVFREIRAERLT